MPGVLCYFYQPELYCFTRFNSFSFLFFFFSFFLVSSVELVWDGVVCNFVLFVL